MTSFLRQIIALPALVSCLAASGPVRAQGGANPCPDGLTGPCCAPASPHLPQLPAVTWADAKQTCWIDCGPFPSVTGLLTLSAPIATGACGEFDVSLSGSLVGCPAPSSSGLKLYYTRHWPQSFPGQGPLVVYRFVAVGQICITPLAAWGCQVEMAPSSPFVFGFVDYAFRKTGPPPCNLTFVAAALAVGHPCDRFVHDPACPFVADPLSPTHPLDQYTLVAPGTNFTPNGLLVPPQGPGNNLPREAIRSLEPNSIGTCTTNERFQSVLLKNHVQQCACVSATTPGGPFWRQSLDGSTQCGSRVATSPICPFNYTPPPMNSPFPTLVAWSIGSWGPGQFPGLPGGNRFFLAQGSATYEHVPTPVCQPVGPRREIYYGVENAWGPPNSKLTRRVDLVDNVEPIVGTNSVTPVVGGPASKGTHVVFFY